VWVLGLRIDPLRLLVRNTRGFTGGWTMGPSAAWFYEGQLHLYRNWNWNLGGIARNLLLGGKVGFWGMENPQRGPGWGSGRAGDKCACRVENTCLCIQNYFCAVSVY